MYRSSYKNARRLAVTEVNNAYRKADSDRWQKLDFVIGVRVQLSNNHTYRDHKGRIRTLVDICDDLKGDYPKDFVFTSWHPHCRCIATPILKSRAEMKADRERILRGEEPTPSPNEIKEMPANFKQWQKTNASRIQGAMERGSLPHWIKDNFIQNADGPLFPLFGYPTQTARLKAFKAKAKEMWQGKTFRDEVTITNKGIKEWLNQPHKHKADKDKAIFQIDDLLSNAEYKGWAVDIHNSSLKSRIYEVKIGGDPSYIIVREFAWGRQLHSITDSNNILKYIKDR